MKDDKLEILQVHQAYISLPIVRGKGPDLFNGGYSIMTNPAKLNSAVLSGVDIVGPCATENLQGEGIARDHEFFKVDSTGQVTSMGDEEGISFAHLSAFIPEFTGKIDYAFTRDVMGLHLQRIARGYTGSLTAKIKGSFERVQLRSPNHHCNPAPALNEALKDQVFFYFLHLPEASTENKYSYEFFEKNPVIVNELGFRKDVEKSCYIRKKDFPQSKDEVEIRLRPDDHLYIVKNPLEFNIVIQFASNDIYEMGGVAGYHMHAYGRLKMQGKDVMHVGGHILNFNGLSAPQVEIMKVEKTLINDNGVVREAYGRDNVGKDIALEALQDKNKIDKCKALSSTITPSDFRTNRKDKEDPWSSCIREKASREKVIAELIARTTALVKKKDDCMQSEEFKTKFKLSQQS